MRRLALLAVLLLAGCPEERADARRPARAGRVPPAAPAEAPPASPAPPAERPPPAPPGPPRDH